VLFCGYPAAESVLPGATYCGRVSIDWKVGMMAGFDDADED